MNKEEEYISWGGKHLFDIMLNGTKYYTTVKLPITDGVKYKASELKEMARMMLPSLENKEFTMPPTGQRVFR